MKSIDIASITESIFKADEVKLKTSGTKLINDPVKGITKIDAPDISKYKVQDEFTQKILEQSFGIKPEVKPVIKEDKIPDIKEVDPEVFVVRLVQLIKEAKQLIKEMTDCGAIGMNMSGPGKSLKKPVSKKKKDRKKKLLLKFKHKFGR
jgi:hypothetical protein